MVSMGQIPDKFIGLEASGIILRVGNNVQNFNIGDEVSFLGHGAHSTVFRTKAAFCQLIPCGLSFAQAACLPLAHCTAYHALINKARAKKGQSILIHSAAGGVGQATIQLAQHLGLEIFATVGSPEKRKILREIYDLPDDHILYSRDLSFAKAVLRLTNGRGVDCVLNSLAGEALRQTWHCIAPFGCFIEIGIKDVLGNSGLDMAPFLRDTTFQTINLEHVQRERPELMAEIMTETFALFRQGVTKPIFPMTVFSVSEVESAFRLMQTGKHTGKIALEYHAQDIVPVLCNPSTTAQSNININGSSTYVLVGGLGGLGRSLAKLLVHLGARYICFISRSGSSSTSPEVTKFIDDLRSREVQANIYSCDIANFEILEGTLHKCSSEMPPIKGVFQCAMVLQDALFETMTHTQWNNSLRSKVQGSWNLHKATPTSLDFFIILSSFSGIIGNRGQSNYAAACTYQDALAMLRHKKGLKAVSIDFGIMRDVGVLAEKGAVGDLKEWEEPFGIREPEFHALIKRAIGQLPVKENEDDFDLPVPPQIVTGIPTAQMFAAASISEPFYYNDAKFSILANTGIGVNGLSNNVSNRSISIRELLSKVESHAEATCLILAALVAKVAKLSQREVADVDVQKSLHSYGVDSLVAVEIRNWIVKEMLADVSVFEVLASVTMGEFAGGVVKKCKGLPEGVS
jgi:NADPH:quinone reductase-like Zn-dependent oxidoreductase/NAD(P)-dependent dehydrogenase (short-subunit alcohol dehydrogenase family)/aryl carrier-like protein